MIELTDGSECAPPYLGHLSAGQAVGRYEVLATIARGDRTTVCLARHLGLGLEVALKELRGFRSTDRLMVQRFLQEARRAGSMSHPNIVIVHDHFECDGTPCIAMEYLSHGSLRDYCRCLDLAQIVGVLEGVLSGLAHAEVRGVVHRDLKPENIMVTAEGRVKICDFGIASATHAVCTWAGIPTPRTLTESDAYTAPEWALGHPVGPWTDLYSVGVIAYELLVGRPPSRELVGPAALAPALGGWVQDLLAQEPHRRTSSAYVAWDSLEEIAIDLWGPRWRRGARITPVRDQATL
jgi:serine/threonine protein kinase